MLSKTETNNDKTTKFMFYRIPSSASGALQPILSLSLKSVDCERWERCLRENLQGCVTYLFASLNCLSIN